MDDLHKAFTFGSLFAGIGGIDLGLERAGMVCKWQVEIDDYATKVLEKHWPDVARFRDVRDCGAHNLTPVDLICGGFPCQDISLVGKGEGIEGKRSGLWSEFYRIICELRPRYVLMENVSALLNRGMGKVLGDLAACGYDAEWQCLPAAAFGALHIRDRIFILAYAQCARRDWLYEWSKEGCLEANTSRCGRNGPNGTTSENYSRRIQGQGPISSKANVAYTDSKPLVWITKPRTKRNPWTIEPDVGRVANGIPHRVDRLRGLGNAVVPQIAEWIGQQIIEAELQWT